MAVPGEYGLLRQTAAENPGSRGQGGFASLGYALAGGNEATGEMAFARGQQIGAQTIDALAQARARVRQNDAAESTADFIESDQAKPLGDALGLSDDMRHYVAATVRGAGEEAGAKVAMDFAQEARRHKIEQGATNPTVGAALALGNGADVLPKPIGTAGSVTSPLTYDPTRPDTATYISPEQQKLNEAQEADRNAGAALKGNQAAQAGAHGGLNDTQWGNLVELTAKGLVAPPTPGSRNYLAYGPQLLSDSKDYAQKNGLPFNTADFSAQKREAGTIQGSQTSINTDSNINRVSGHIKLLRQVADEWAQAGGGSDARASNGLMSLLHEQFGSGVPTALNEIAQFVGTEGVKAAAQMSAGTKEERNKLASGFTTINSPDQITQNSEGLAGLVKSQADARNQQWVQSKRPGDYYQRNLTQDARDVLGIKTGAPAAKPGAAPAPGAAPTTGVPAGFKVTVR